MSKFYDIDLPFGEKYEQQLKEFFEGTNIEVKTERDIWKETGNHVVEYKYKGNPSGIAITQAEFWGVVLTLEDKPVMFYVLPTDKVKHLARKYYNSKRIIKGGDNNDSEMVLVPIKELATYCL
tara:strand:- start:96 stop:464 length:369 start_codon:yes stop_codon:yes gene_type:complete